MGECPKLILKEVRALHRLDESFAASVADPSCDLHPGRDYPSESIVVSTWAPAGSRRHINCNFPASLYDPLSIHFRLQSSTSVNVRFALALNPAFIHTHTAWAFV